jgi:hypothetical protein
MENKSLRAILRAIEFKHRPGHSDQLHLEVWHQGFNLARDPGTYLYNAKAPWDNSLAGAWCHNTVMVAGVEPMLRAGRFLWQKWSRAVVLERSSSPGGLIEVLCAMHTAAQWPGIRHVRTVSLVSEDLILVVDDFIGEGSQTIRVNWTMPDIEWKQQGDKLALVLPAGRVTLGWELDQSRWGLYRAGAIVGGEEIVEDPTTFGWHAPTYAQREPGLQLVIDKRRQLPMRVVTYWAFKDRADEAIQVAWLPVGFVRPAFDRLNYSGEVWAR